jgi:hypothetical protein
MPTKSRVGDERIRDVVFNGSQIAKKKRLCSREDDYKLASADESDRGQFALTDSV